MTDLPTSGGALAAVQDGMRVVDTHEDEVGTVVAIRMGDPDAVTAEGQEVGDVGDDDRLPPGAEERLLRTGYLRIHAKGWFAGNRWASTDEVSHVADGVVHLSVAKDALLK